MASVAEKLGAMPTLVVGMPNTRQNHHMPTTSVGMAPAELNTFYIFRHRNNLAFSPDAHDRYHFPPHDVREDLG